MIKSRDEMEDKSIINIISKNMAHFRKLSGMTQAQLAEKLNYSDKSISKWERGEGVPDASVLYELACILGVTPNDFYDENSVHKKKIKPPLTLGKKIYISFLVSVFVWFVMTTLYVLLSLLLSFAGADFSDQWIMFIYAIPIMAIVDIVLCERWKWKIASAVFVSLLVWGVTVSFHLSMSVFGAPLNNLSIVYLVPAVLQVLVILWYVQRFLKSKKV